LKFYVTIVLALVYSIPTANLFAADEPLVVPSLEQLLNTEVQIASKRAEPWQTTEAAVFVLTHDDIVRSGARTIPDCLRLVPGLDVAQINSNTWAVSARGYEDRFSNNLLVMVDGRVVYNHLFDGVFWDVQDLLLEDVDRIEVIRGPGAAMWGANAVNGVINILTRSSKQTQGLYLSAGFGNSEKADLSVRWGEAMGPRTWARAWGQYFKRGATTILDTDLDAADRWQYRRGGFRFDGERASGAQWMFEGQGSKGNLGEIQVVPTLEDPWVRQAQDVTSVEEGSLQFQWHSPKDLAWGWNTSAYGEQNSRAGYLMDGRWSNCDVSADVQHQAGRELNLTGGLEGRYTEDRLHASYTQMAPDHLRQGRLSLFVQGDQGFKDGLFNVTAGSKLEFTGEGRWMAEPNVRVGWKPAEEWFSWGSFSVADRIPSRGESGVQFDYAAFPVADPSLGVTLPMLVQTRGSSGLDPIKLYAIDFGSRYVPQEDWVLSLSLFGYSYQDPLVLQPSVPTVALDGSGQSYLLQQLQVANGGAVTTWGCETWASYKPASNIRVRGWVSYYREHYVYPAWAGSGVSGGQTPRWQASLESYWDPTSRVSLNAAWRYVDPLPNLQVPAYQTMDVRVAWRPWKSWELAATGRNLFAAKHVEFVSPYINVVTSTVDRSYLFSLSRGW